MLAFFPDVIRPALEALQPQNLVEIGSESGKTTRLLVDFARDHDACVHAIDPAPGFDAEAWQREAPGTFTITRLPSLVGLPSIAQFDVVFIDGDHNWYTVFHELQLIAKLSRDIGQPHPLVFLHDVGWPYGRRDMYYTPTTIPEAHRQPYARKGILPTSSRLVSEGGINAKLCNALQEGGPKNGVLTAIEDYLDTVSEPIDLVKIPAVFGLGILLPAAMADANPEVARKVRVWATPEVERFIDRLEMARIAMMTGATF